MTNFYRKVAKTGVTIAVAGVITAGSVAYAETSPTLTKSAMPFYQKILVHATGKVILHGSVQSVSANSFTMTSWGSTWTVKTGTSTKFTLKSGLSAVKAGDNVMVTGVISKDAAMTVNASLVNDQTAKQALKMNKKFAHEVKKEMKDMKEHAALNNGGTVQGILGGVLTVQAKKGTTFTVNTDANTNVYTKNWATSSVSSISVGNEIKVFGNKTGTTTVSAKLIHNLSL